MDWTKNAITGTPATTAAAFNGVAKPPLPTDWSEPLLNPSGLVGDVVRFIRESSGMHQPKFALAAGLTFCAAAIGRAVKDRTGQRTNLYTLAIGNTSAGKNDPLKIIGKLTASIGASKLLAGEVTSDSALEILVDAFPVRLFLLDEVGQYLTSLKGAGANNGHLRTVIPALTKCWSAAGGVFMGKARAKDGNGQWKPPKAIAEPCVSIYGTSAPDVLFGSMAEGDFSDGSIPRFIPFMSLTRPRFVARNEVCVPDSLRNRLSSALLHLGAKPHGAKRQDGTQDDVPEPMLVDETDEAASIFEALESDKNGHLAQADNGDAVEYLWGKSVENARRVALTVAALRNPDKPVVEAIDAKYATELMRVVVGDFVQAVRDRVAGSKAERDKKKLLLIIRQSGNDGVTKSHLTRRTQSMRPIERDEALFDLCEAGEIEEHQETGSGAKCVTRYCIGNRV